MPDLPPLLLAVSLWPLGQGILIGLGAAVPPGPVNLEIVRRTTRGGFAAGATVGLGAVTVDVAFALLTVLGVLVLVNGLPWVRVPITVFGILLLAYLGYGSLRSFLKHLRQRDGLGAAEAGGGFVKATPWAGYVTGLLLCSTSPYQALFWLTAVPAITGESAAEHPMAAVLLCVGVFAATLAWVSFFSGLLAAGVKVAGARWLPAAMDAVGGVVLIGFAAFAAFRFARSLTG